MGNRPAPVCMCVCGEDVRVERRSESGLGVWVCVRGVGVWRDVRWIGYQGANAATKQHKRNNGDEGESRTVGNDLVCSGTAQHSAVQHSTVQYSRVQYSAAQCSIVQCSTVYSAVQYSAVQCRGREERMGVEC